MVPLDDCVDGLVEVLVCELPPWLPDEPLPTVICCVVVHVALAGSHPVQVEPGRNPAFTVIVNVPDETSR